ncbi:MAG TPA: rod shape-determining protein MreD [Lachnospiraceae bacterium]|nr:rod shape-determining protein MreD [Lachnospiraceae bacterium]
MIQKIVIALEIFMTFLLQTTLFPAISIASVVPNLLLILTVSNGFMRGRKCGLFTGFFSGLMIDIFYGDLMGFYALIYMYIGFLNGMLCKVYYDDDVKVPMVLVALSDLAYGLAVYGFQFLLRGRTQIFYYVWHIIIPEVVYTTLVTLILYRIYYRINNLATGNEREGQRLPWLRK